MLVVIIQIVALYFAMGFMYSAGCMRGGMAEKKSETLYLGLAQALF